MYEFTRVLLPSLLLERGKTATTKQTDLQSGPRLCAPPEELRSAKRLTHHTLVQLKTLYKSTWDMAVGKRPLPLRPRTCRLSASSVLLCKGVAVDPAGTHLPFKKSHCYGDCV